MTLGTSRALAHSGDTAPKHAPETSFHKPPSGKQRSGQKYITCQAPVPVASPGQNAHKEENGLELAPRQAPRPCGRYARVPTRAHKLIQASRAKPGQRV